MWLKDFKATIYDYFGYFLPGLILTVLGYSSWLHSIGIFDIYSEILKVIKEINGIGCFLIICFCYFLGHALSTISLFLIEKNIFEKVKELKERSSLEKLVSLKKRNIFFDKYEKTFSCKYEDKDFRTVICYVESYELQVYSTAFVFLTFYGMARSSAIVMSFLCIWEIFNVTVFNRLNSIDYAFCYFILMIAFYYQYYKFYKYFRNQIISGFILPSKEK